MAFSFSWLPDRYKSRGDECQPLFSSLGSKPHFGTFFTRLVTLTVFGADVHKGHFVSASVVVDELITESILQFHTESSNTGLEDHIRESLNTDNFRYDLDLDFGFAELHVTDFKLKVRVDTVLFQQGGHFVAKGGQVLTIEFRELGHFLYLCFIFLTS